jgi:cytochrome c oxidase subunit 4
MSFHVEATRTYVVVLLALLVGTALTVWIAFVDLGWANDAIALTIATVKGALVLLFFMHLRRSTRLVWLVAAAGFLWLLILFSLTLSDYATRGLATG